MSNPAWQSENPYASFGLSAAASPAEQRVAFIRRTYTHLMVAVYALAALEWAILSSGVMDKIMPALMSRGAMLVVFGGFLVASWVANHWAQSETSVGKQYLGLSLYVVAEAIFLAPMLYFAKEMTIDPGTGMSLGVVPAAAIATLVMFGGLSAVAWFSGADFSFLRSALMLGGFAAFGLILAGWIFGLNLGVWFSVGMIVLASGYILYDTSNVMNHYRPTQHVAASLALFASVALLFWYVLRLLMVLSRR